jgi:hypothetical protein
MAGSLTAIAAGATLAFGAFGAGLGDLVALDATADNTLASPLIVVGDTAKADDTLSGMDVAAAMAGFATKEVSLAGSSGVVSATGTDAILLSTDLNKTYLDSRYNQARASVTETDLPVLLKTNSFTDKNSVTISIAQNIVLGSQTIQFGRISDFTEPVLYSTFSQSTPYTLNVYFLGGLDTTQIDSNYEIKMFNKAYTFGNTYTNTSLELYSSTGAQTVTLDGAGDVQPITIDGVDHTMELTGWNSGGSAAFLKIDGVSPTDLPWTQGTTHTFPGTTTKVLVKNVNVLNTGGASGGTATGQVVLFIGTDKLTLTDSTAVMKNDDSLPVLQ